MTGPREVTSSCAQEMVSDSAYGENILRNKTDCDGVNKGVTTLGLLCPSARTTQGPDAIDGHD
jgi:hypothetical protein